ncbi:MAG: segregation/condensation protein A [Leptospiraceae bacterium]|nr:segregation/condensation protein A [Leptospiraceae bacterium]MDW7975527.1 segregation/condensation protein A [Leptospiraceae bacterium]
MHGNETQSIESFLVKWKGPNGEEEGPLYVLWQLIESYKVDIFEVSLQRITEDFLNFIRKAKEWKIELASNFALIASKLIFYKSRILLPDPGFVEEDQDRLPKEMIQQLLEYRKYQQAAEHLQEIQEFSEGIFTKNNHYVFWDYEETYSINDLIRVYAQFLKSKQQTKRDSFIEIELENITVEEKMNFILEVLQDNIHIGLFDLFENHYQISLIEFIVTFLAILELARLRKVIIEQKYIFGPILIFKNTAIVR